MNRRGHLSNKIPNVKLRPAPANASSKIDKRANSPEIWREAFEDGTNDAGDPDVGTSLPWKGIVITFTGIEDKPYYAGLVMKLGGEVESALTVHVTHVISEAYASPKYIYAIEHRLPVMIPLWIEDAHRQWLEGKEVDVSEESEKYRLQPFNGLKIAISGIEPLNRRRDIIHWITKCGGLYSKDLDRSCSHLISAKPTSDSDSSEKVRWAMKELADRGSKRMKGKRVDGQDMRIVYEEWIWDCVAFRGRLSEDKYDARNKRGKAKVKAEDVLNGTAFQEEPKAAPQHVPEKDEPAAIRKRKREAMDSLVGDIISISARQEPQKVDPDPATKDVDSTKAELDEPPLKLPKVDDAEADSARRPTIIPPPQDGPREPERKPSMLHFPRSTSFATTSAKEAAGPSKALFSRESAAPVDVKPAIPTPRFFHGLRFSHVIREECAGLENALLAHGATLVPETDRLGGVEVDYVIQRLNSANSPILVDGVKQPVIVTECWVEACLFEKRMIAPTDHLVFQPLPVPMPVPGANKLIIHLSGWSTSELVYLKRLIRAIGATLALKLDRNTTHFVCPSATSMKAAKCFEWGIPVLRDSWLLAIGRTGQIPLEGDHAHSGPADLPSKLERKSGLGSDSNMTMSGVSDGGMIDFSAAKTSTPQHSVLQAPPRSGESGYSPNPPLSPSRMLKLNPTHIDDAQDIKPQSRPGSQGETTMPLPLSPPNPERARILNHANIEHLNEESIDSKFSRTSSAPPIGSLEKNPVVTGDEQIRSVSIGGDVTDVLRQMAQGDQITPSGRMRIQRRSRPTSRLKSAFASGLSPGIMSVSPNSDQAEVSFDEVAIEAAVEESFRVKYVDPTAERERKKLMDAARRSEAARK